MSVSQPQGEQDSAAAAGAAARPLSGLSKQVVVVWLLAAAALPLAILLPAGGVTIANALGSAVGVALLAGVGVAYARRVRWAWHLMQAAMLVGVFLGGYWGNRWLFVGASVLMIYLYFSLYATEVRREFGVHTAPREVGILLVLLGMCSVLAIWHPPMLEGGNLLDLVRQFSIVGVMAVGMTMVIIIGGIDLSVGSVVAISGCLAALAIREWDCSIYLAITIAVLVGGAAGCFNGALISRFRMPPFVVTLGTMSMARSLAYVATQARQVTVTGRAAQPAFSAIAWADTLGVPNPVWIMAIVVFVGHVFLRYTRTGRHIYYVGANEEAARLSGLHVTAIKWLVYGLCGLLAGLAGMVQASRVATGQPTAGMGDELRVIAAVIIGGASFSGGVGTVLGALLGAAIMGVLLQGMVVLNVNPHWHGFVAGAVIIGAVALDMLRRRR